MRKIIKKIKKEINYRLEEFVHVYKDNPDIFQETCLFKAFFWGCIIGILLVLFLIMGGGLHKYVEMVESIQTTKVIYNVGIEGAWECVTHDDICDHQVISISTYDGNVFLQRDDGVFEPVEIEYEKNNYLQINTSTSTIQAWISMDEGNQTVNLKTNEVFEDGESDSNEYIKNESGE